MRALRSSTGDDRRGGTLVLVALSMFLLLGMGAIAVDAGAAFAWRVEAQRIADAAALAGGSAFLEMPATVASQPATDRAYEYALQHSIKGVAVDSSEVTVQVIPAEMKVRVGIDRTGLPTWFARILGFGSVDIGAVAAAQAVEAGAARCLKPLALPDAWDDADQDINGDHVWNPGEAWDFGSDPNDRYQAWGGPNDPFAATATGYGSDFRADLPADFGRFLQIKATDPNSAYNFEPGIFFPWRIPVDPNQQSCATGGGGSQSSGGASYRRNLCQCNNSLVELGTPYDLEPGNMVGPTHQGVSELLAADPTAYWEPAANGGKGGVARPDANSASGYVEIGVSSPRVIKVALFDPTQITKSGMQTIVFNNFALMFLEDQQNAQAPVEARFMYFVGGSPSQGSTSGPLVLYLRLVE